VFTQPDIFGFVQIKCPTVNKQASDKGGNLFSRCHFKEREMQRGGGGKVRARREGRRAHHIAACSSEIRRIWHSYPEDC